MTTGVTACGLALALAALAWTAPAWAQRVGTRLPDGRDVGVGTIEPDLQAQQQQLREACRRELTQAADHIHARRWGEARMVLDRAQHMTADRAQYDQVRQLYVQVETEGQRQLGLADALTKADRYVEALDAYERIHRVFLGLPSSRTARRKADALEADPKARPAILEVQAAAMRKTLDSVLGVAASGPASSRPALAAGGLAGQIRRIEIERQVKALELLTTLAGRYGQSPTGQQAAAELAILKADEPFMRAIAARQGAQAAERALARARAYRQAGIKDKAVEYYRRVTQEFPHTPQAAQADDEIKALTAQR